MKRRYFAIGLLLLVLFYPLAHIEGKNMHTQIKPVAKKNQLKSSNLEDGKKNLTYGDFGEMLYNLVYEENNPEIKKLAKESKESQGLAWMKALSLVDGEKREEDDLSRIEAVYLLYGLANRLSLNIDDKQDGNFDFADYEKIAIPYKIPTAWAQREGLFIGDENKKLQPKDSLTYKDFMLVLKRGEKFFKGKKIQRPIFFNAYEMTKVEVKNSQKLGLQLVYTGSDYLEEIGKILNNYQGDFSYNPNDGWTDSLTVYSATGARYEYEINDEAIEYRGMIYKDEGNKQWYSAIQDYLLK